MASVSARIAHRPIRVGFLVESGSSADIREASSIALCMWGGMVNPMIPLGTDVAEVERYIDLFGVDVVHPIRETATSQALLKDRMDLVWPQSIGESRLFRAYTTNNDAEALSCLDIAPFARELRERRVRGLPMGAWSNVTWSSEDPLDLVFALQFGTFAGGWPGASQFPMLLEACLSPRGVAIGKSEAVPDHLATTYLPWDVTQEKLERYGDQRGARYPGLVLLDETQLTHLVSFWNLRAAGADVVPISVRHWERQQGFALAFWKSLEPTGNPHSSPDSWRCIWHIEGLEVPEEIKAALNPGSYLLAEIGVSADSFRRIEPIECRGRSETVLANVEHTQDKRPELSCTALWNLTADDRLDSRNRSQWLITELRVFGEFAYAGHTLDVPRFLPLRETLSRHLVFDYGQVRLGTNGLGIIHDVEDSVLRVRPIGMGDLVRELFGACGLKATASVPGKMADHLVATMGGLRQCWMFREPGIRGLLQSRDARKGVTKTAATQILLDPTGQVTGWTTEKYEELALNYKQRRREGPSETLRTLLKRGVLRVGLGLRCGSCEDLGWHALDDLRDMVACAVCGATIDAGSQVLERAEWRYRLAGMFQREDREMGSITTVLATNAVEEHMMRFEAGSYCHGVDIDVNHAQCEIDVVWLKRGARGRPVVVLCETKAGKAERLVEQCKRLGDVAGRLANHGIEVWVVVAALTTDYGTAEREALGALRSRGVQTIVLGKRELEADILDTWHVGADGSPPPFPREVRWSQIAMNGAWRYLGQGPPKRTEYRRVKTDDSNGTQGAGGPPGGLGAGSERG